MKISPVIVKIQQKRLGIALVLFFVVFIITRFPVFYHFGVPFIFDDSADFTHLARQLISGEPDFGRRTPFYPLFLAASWLIWHDITIVSMMQSIFTVAAACIFIYTFYRYFTNYTIGAALAITIFSSLIVCINFESVLMSESLYTSTTIIWVCSMITAIKERTPSWFAVSSALLMTVILIRPSGLYLVPLSALIFIYMFVNKYSFKARLFFLLPALIMFLCLSTYNLVKINRFGISSQGTDMIGNVLFFVEKDAAYPDYVNAAIENQVIKQLPPDELEFIKTSWDVTTVQALQIKHQNLMKPLMDAIMAANPGNREKFISDCKLVTWHAIRTHPSAFMKFFTIQMLHYFGGFNDKNVTAFPFLKDYKSCFTNRLQRYFYDNANKSGRFYLFDSPALTPLQGTRIMQSIETGSWHRFNQFFSIVVNALFRNYLWLLFYFIVLFTSAVKLIIKGFKAENEFIVFAICCMILLSMVFHSLVNVVMIRYTYPFFWIYYLCPILLAIMLPEGWGKKPVFLKKATRQGNKKENAPMKPGSSRSGSPLKKGKPR
jgi:hypothetical protein